MSKRTLAHGQSYAYHHACAPRRDAKIDATQVKQSVHGVQPSMVVDDKALSVMVNNPYERLQFRQFIIRLGKQYSKLRVDDD